MTEHLELHFNSLPPELQEQRLRRREAELIKQIEKENSNANTKTTSQ